MTCWFKFENGQMFHSTRVDVAYDVAHVWPGSCNHVTPRHAYYFDLQHPTGRNRVAKGMQHIEPNDVAICGVEMLRSLGRGLRRFLSRVTTDFSYL